MRVLCASVLAIEAIIVFLATSLAASNGSLSNVGLVWAVGLALMFLLVLTAGLLGRPWGVALGWVMQGLVLATSIVVGWVMLVVGIIFVVLWYLAVRNGRRVDAIRAPGSDAA
jgi:hypothetical protein